MWAHRYAPQYMRVTYIHFRLLVTLGDRKIELWRRTYYIYKTGSLLKNIYNYQKFVI